MDHLLLKLSSSHLRGSGSVFQRLGGSSFAHLGRGLNKELKLYSDFPFTVLQFSIHMFFFFFFFTCEEDLKGLTFCMTPLRPPGP